MYSYRAERNNRQDARNHFGVETSVGFTSLAGKEEQAVFDHAAAAISLSTMQEFPLWETGVTVLRGWALAKQGAAKEGLANIHRGLALYRAVGGVLVQTVFLALLAETYRETGHLEE